MYLRKPSVMMFNIDNDYEYSVNKIANAITACYKLTPPNTLQKQEEYIAKRMHEKHESVLEHHSISVAFVTNRGVTHELVRHRLCAFTQESTRYANYSKDRFGNQCTFILPWWVMESDFCMNYLNTYGQTKDSDIFELNPEAFFSSLYTHTLDVRFKEELECENIVQAIGGLLSSEILPPENETQEMSIMLYNWLLGLFMSEKQYMAQLNITKRPELARGVLPNDLSTLIYHTANVREWRHIMKLRSLGTTGNPHPDIKWICDELLNKLMSNYPVFFRDLVK